MKKIDKCKEYSQICNYCCCNQSKDTSFSLWLYPGEYENSKLDKSHIRIINRENNALIGKCCCSQEQRKKCDGTQWLKPLDCWSYPFLPFIENGKLVLLIDSVRCPMAQKSDLHEHYRQTLKAWQVLLEDKAVYHSISCLKENNYISFFSKYEKLLDELIRISRRSSVKRGPSVSYIRV